MAFLIKKEHIVAVLFLLLFYAFLYVPIISLLYTLFLPSAEPIIPLAMELMQKKSFLLALFNSLLISLITVLCTLFLCFCSLGYVFLGGNVEKIESIMYINIIIPEIILAISLVLLFSFFNIPLGFSTLIVAYTTAFLGYSFPFLSQKWKEFDKTLITAAKDLGATTKIIWKTLIFPMFQDTFYSIAFLVFIITFDDYVFAYFCGNSETLTLPLYILLSLRMGISPELKVLILLFFIFSLLFGIAYLSRINSKRNPCDD